VDCAADLRVALLDWAAAHRRDLPWRSTRDPWAVLVSELMLQQTQVTRVLPAYTSFLERFPTVDACARASAGDVVRAWAGLGYNRRAVNLHRAAVEIAQRGFPTTLTGLQALPGVGPYTARAVMAYALEADVAVVDTNVARVLARLHGRSLVGKEAQTAADQLLAQGDAWAWNQGIMDLGARLCRPRPPDCEACPLASWCGWCRAGRPDPDPAVGSAHVSGGQSAFAGSDRQGRGRLVDALRRGPVRAGDLPGVMGWPDDAMRAQRVAATLVADGLVVGDDDGTIHLA
jgi:A/G-specific adenine glycosylase